VAFIGDVMLGRGVNEEIAYRPPEYFWGTTLPVLRSADAVIANLECAITNHEKEWQETPKAFYFRADPKAIDVLRYLDSAGIYHPLLVHPKVWGYPSKR